MRLGPGVFAPVGRGTAGRPDRDGQRGERAPHSHDAGTACELQETVDETDNRPMRALGHRTPAEAFADELPESAANKDVALTNR